MQFSQLATAAYLLPAVLAAHLQISVPAHAALPQPSSLPPSTFATLTTSYTSYRAFLNVANTFSFRNVSSGSYLLDVSCSTHEFLPLRIDVSYNGQYDGIAEAGAPIVGEVVEAWDTFRGNEWENKGEVVVVHEKSGAKSGAESIFELEAKVKAAKDYYMPRNSFSPLAILKNPMILIAGFSMLVIFGMPYLIENMDPELKEEFEKQQKSGNSVSGLLAGGNQANPGASLANFDAAAWLAGSGKKTAE